MRKKFFLTIVLLIGILVNGTTGPAGEEPGQNNNGLIRLHVIANSDSDADQALKYKIKDVVVKEVRDEFARSQSIEESRQILLTSLPRMEKAARETLVRLGSKYDVRTQYGRFDFPTKYYGNFSLPAGEYEAVRVVIGAGQGANWWCVLFPPLCFVETTEEDTLKESKVKNGYPVNTPDKFKQGNFRVSFKLVKWLRQSFPVLAKILN
ncbi:MAG: stage II sporulation protein R [Peptococcaceae bacterium]